MKDVHGWIQPFLIAALRLIELLDLLIKHGENIASRIAFFDTLSEWVREKVYPRAFFVRFQGIAEI